MGTANDAEVARERQDRDAGGWFPDIERHYVEASASKQVGHLAETTSPIEQAAGRNAGGNFVGDANVVPPPDRLVQMHEMRDTERLGIASDRSQERKVFGVAGCISHVSFGRRFGF